MKNQINRKAILLSAFFTALLLTLAAGGFFLARGWTMNATAAEDPADAVPSLQTLPPPVIEQIVTQPSSEDAAVTVYQAQLEAAYAALDEAYTQIETLQSAQTQVVAGGGYEDDDDDEEDGHEDDDKHEEREQSEPKSKGTEREHDDD